MSDWANYLDDRPLWILKGQKNRVEKDKFGKENINFQRYSFAFSQFVNGLLVS